MSDENLSPAFGRTGPGDRPQAASAHALADLLCQPFMQRLMPHPAYLQGMDLPPYAISRGHQPPRTPRPPEANHPWPLHGWATEVFFGDLRSFEVARQIHESAQPFEFTFVKDEVRFGLVGETVANLMSLTDEHALCTQLHQRMRLNFAHWRDDPREIALIPEVRDFFRQVTEQWPFWLHFLQPSADNLALFLSLLSPTQTVGIGEHVLRARLDDSVVGAFHHLVECTLRLHDTHALAPSITLQTDERLRHALAKTFH